MSSQGEISYEVKVEEAKCFMWLRLPEYVVDCLVSAGFDTMPLIVDMDEMPLKEVEEFVPVFRGSPHIIPPGSFKFPSRHRKAILNLIQR